MPGSAYKMRPQRQKWVIISRSEEGAGTVNVIPFSDESKPLADPATECHKRPSLHHQLVLQSLLFMPKTDLDRAFERIRAVARELDLPGVIEGTLFGRPCLQVRGTSFIGSKDGKVLIIHCAIDEKELLLESVPEIYFETEHYRGYPAILAKPDGMDSNELRLRIEHAWRMHASKRQLAEFDARRATASTRPNRRANKTSN